MSTPTTSPRAISLHERYAVARRCLNSPSIVSVAAILQLTPKPHLQRQEELGNFEQAFSAVRAHLTHRIDALLTQYPLLSYCVEAPRSCAPRWTPIQPPPTSNDILHIGSTLSTADANTLFSRAISAEQIALPSSTQLDKGPLWKVQLSRIGDGTSCLVVLATDHVINDGRGTLNLFQMLLRDDKLVSGETVKVGRELIPPASDRIFNFKPSTTYMLGVVWQELILPKLPLGKKLKAKLRGPVSWPASSVLKASTSMPSNKIVRQPRSCKPALDIIFVSSPHLISKLKKLAKLHIDPSSPTKKAATLHAIIHTLAIAALYAAIAQSHHIATSAAELSRFNLVLNACTPISLREETPPTPKQRHATTLSADVEPPAPAPLLPTTTGNYVSSYTDDIRVRGGETFWRLTNRFASDLASPRGRKLAKQHMGMLAYIPDFDASSHKRKRSDEEVVKSSLEGHDVRYANGWEKFFGDKAAGSTPFDSALSLSNLGLVDLSSVTIASDTSAQWKVGSLTWAQSHTPQGEAFVVDLVGFAQGETQTLSIAISSRPPAFADEQLHDRFKAFLQRLVIAFAAEPPAKLSQDTEGGSHLLDLNTDPTFASLAHFLISSP
ncbi:hypothetical protein EX895_003120 [Sporisorium graminicola]|uniref:Condensation domain-containing protein n=1 Tax=Sporisorium graminicola TaxID=280036 RepID=A0A4U7KTW3_9BASI|nr:hypothetical protein EX895_003120 [Sporisorium graminicola]TKY88024.1 hypothetical protein EX895_003120 [Sporisorium graminicola]